MIIQTKSTRRGRVWTWPSAIFRPRARLLFCPYRVHRASAAAGASRCARMRRPRALFSERALGVYYIHIVYVLQRVLFVHHARRPPTTTTIIIFYITAPAKPPPPPFRHTRRTPLVHRRLTIRNVRKDGGIRRINIIFYFIKLYFISRETRLLLQYHVSQSYRSVCSFFSLFYHSPNDVELFTRTHTYYVHVHLWYFLY